jgi:hypothetical protein
VTSLELIYREQGKLLEGLDVAQLNNQSGNLDQSTSSLSGIQVTTNEPAN